MIKLLQRLFKDKMPEHCVSHQVSISEADLQAMGGTITMVTQEGTTITIPAHDLAAQGAHSVTMVTADGSDEQVSLIFILRRWFDGRLCQTSAVDS